MESSVAVYLPLCRIGKEAVFCLLIFATLAGSDSHRRVGPFSASVTIIRISSASYLLL